MATLARRQVMSLYGQYLTSTFGRVNHGSLAPLPRRRMLTRSSSDADRTRRQSTTAPSPEFRFFALGGLNSGEITPAPGGWQRFEVPQGNRVIPQRYRRRSVGA